MNELSPAEQDAVEQANLPTGLSNTLLSHLTPMQQQTLRDFEERKAAEARNVTTVQEQRNFEKNKIAEDEHKIKEIEKAFEQERRLYGFDDVLPPPAPEPEYPPVPQIMKDGQTLVADFSTPQPTARGSGAVDPETLEEWRGEAGTYLAPAPAHPDDALRAAVERMHEEIATMRGSLANVADQLVGAINEKQRYAAALLAIIQDPIPNLTHVRIAKVALGWEK